MKIVSSFMDDVHLEKGKYHAFSFETSYLLKLFKQHLFACFSNKSQSETQFLNVLDSSNNQIKTRDFHFITFDCHHINLAIEKDTINQIQKLLYHQLENNPNMVENFSLFQTQLSSFASGLELMDEDLSIEFQFNEKSIFNLIKSFEIIIEYDEDEYIPNYKVREFLIKSLLKMNTSQKEPILVISHPETDVGRKDFDFVISAIKRLDITTIVLSSQKDFLTAAADERLFLVNQYGEFYDIINLRKELKAFNIIKGSAPEELIRYIALMDFNMDYQLLDGEIKDFLMSNSL